MMVVMATHLPTSISPATAAEYNYGVAGGTAIIKVYAPVSLQIVNTQPLNIDSCVSLTKLLTTKVEFCALLCAPCVMKSNFSFALPLQSWTAMGIKFSLKSPAVGSMKRHCPLEALRDTAVNALVAVLSKACAWATALGCNSPPARETGTGVVGLKSGMPGPTGAFVVVT
jgi:hypothetical protein